MILKKIFMFVICTHMGVILYSFLKIGEARFILTRKREGREDSHSFGNHMAQVGGNSLYLVPFPDIDPVYNEEQQGLKNKLNTTIGIFWLVGLLFVIEFMLIVNYCPEVLNKNPRPCKCLSQDDTHIPASLRTSAQLAGVRLFV